MHQTWYRILRRTSPPAGWKRRSLGTWGKSACRTPRRICGLPGYRFRISRSASMPSGVQFVEQRLGVFEIGGVETLGEPVIDFREHHTRLVATPLLREQPREAHRRAQ